MSRTMLGAVATAALFATAPSTEAAMRTTGTYGAWTVAEGLGNQDTPMCNAALLGADRSFFIKAFGDVYALQTFKDGWKIPVDQPADVVLQVDDAPAMKFVGYGLEVTA
jgi:hypothetical protein